MALWRHWWPAAVFALLAAMLVIVLGWAADAFGRHIPTFDVSGDYLIGLTVAVALGFTILLWPVEERERQICLALWALKMAVALGAMLLYEARYDFLDAYTYFRRSLEPPAQMTGLGLAFGTEAITRIFSAFWFVIPPSYHAAKVICAYLGLIAILMFARIAGSITRRGSPGFLWLFGLFPSILFWSSTAGKDPMILLGIAGSISAMTSWMNRRTASSLLVALVFVLATAAVRPWIALMIVVAFGAAVAIEIMRRRLSASGRRWAMVAFVALGSVALSLSIRFLPSAMLLTQLEAVSSGWAEGGSAAARPPSFDTWADVVKFWPLGAFTALYRPLPGEVTNVFGLLSGMENLVLLAGTVYGLFIAWQQRKVWTGPVVLLTCFVLLWLGLYAFLSYQNLGTAVRFKLQVLPVFLTLLAWGGFSRLRERPVPGAVPLRQQ